MCCLNPGIHKTRQAVDPELKEKEIQNTLRSIEQN